jgi:ribonuclease J
MHSLVKAKNFIPVHGEYRHLLRHSELAKSLGMRDENVMMVENGAQISLRNGQITRLEDVKAGEVLIDGFGIGDATSVVLRDRAQLAEDGILIATVAINKASGDVIGSPVILTRGLVYQDEAEKLNAEIQRILVEALKNIKEMPKFDIDEAKMILRRPIRNFFVKKIGRSPVVLPVFHLI